jgi:hypothetical protein
MESKKAESGIIFVLGLVLIIIAATMIGLGLWLFLAWTLPNVIVGTILLVLGLGAGFWGTLITIAAAIAD